MTPTFTKQDLKRISAHFNQTPEEFTKKWLVRDKNKDLVNKNQPCQFLNLKDNKCSIYAIRPVDCSGFPICQRKNGANTRMCINKTSITARQPSRWWKMKGLLEM